MKTLFPFALLVFITIVSCSKTELSNPAINAQTQSNTTAVQTGVLIGSDSGFYLLNAINGKTIWNYRPALFTDQFCSSTACVYGSNVIFNLGDSLYSANIRTGIITWSVFMRHFRSAICISNDKVYLGTRSGTICLNASTGAHVWNFSYAQSESRTNHTSSPTVVNGIVYVCGASDPTLYALNALTGALVWKKAIFTYPVFCGPCVYNNTVYI